MNMAAEDTEFLVDIARNQLQRSAEDLLDCMAVVEVGNSLQKLISEIIKRFVEEYFFLLRSLRMDSTHQSIVMYSFTADSAFYFLVKRFDWKLLRPEFSFLQGLP